MVEAPRGIIYDRNGEPLVENRGGLSVGLLPMDMYDPEDEAADFQREIASLAGVLGMPVGDVLDGYKRAYKDPYMTYVLEEDVPEDTVVAYLKEHSDEFPGVIVEKTYLREYSDKALAAHLLGYVGEISQTDLDQEEFIELKAGAHVGKDGVERQYDSYLRGTDGWKTVEVNAGGQPIDFVDRRGRPGRQQPGADYRQRSAGGRRGGDRRGHPARARRCVYQCRGRGRSGHRSAQRRDSGYGLVPGLRPVDLGGRHQ